MASKNSKNKSQPKKASDVSESVINEIMDMNVAPKQKKEAESTVAEVEAPVVEEKVEEATPAEETAPAETVVENTETVTPDVTVTEAVLSAPAADAEEGMALAVPTVEEGPLPAEENPTDFFKDDEKKPAEETVAEAKEENVAAPKPVEEKPARPRRRTTREVYGYDVSGYNYDL